VSESEILGDRESEMLGSQMLGSASVRVRCSSVRHSGGVDER